MKKTILLLALILCSSYGFSQDALYGVRAGFNISDLDFEGDNQLPHTHRNGFAIGFFGEYSLGNVVSIAPEIQFSAEGSKQETLYGITETFDKEVGFEAKNRNLQLGVGVKF